VVVWPATDSAGRPPSEIARQFPDLAVEVPRAFARQFQGRMPLMRVGWGMIRPRAQAGISEAPAVPPLRQVQPAPQPALQIQPPQKDVVPSPPPQPVPQPPPQRAEQRQAEPQAEQRAESPQPELQLIAPEPARPRRRPPPFQNMHRVQ
jgi:outer membrane biosynthesis protein TonB